MRRFVLVLVFGLVSCQQCSGVDAPVVASASKKQSQSARRKIPVGTNLAAIADWSPEHPFVDVFKTSRDWISGAEGRWDDGRKLDVDARGWVRSLQPGQWARTLMLWEVGHYPAGQYVVLYEGEGEIDYGHVGKARRIDERSRPGRDLIDVDPQRGRQGIELVIRKTNPNNPIRNIRVLMPGGVCSKDYTRYCDREHPCAKDRCEAFEKNHEKVIYNPAFLKRIRSFSALRFMDWMDTNHSQISKWSDRPKMEDARWSTHGVPLEAMMALVNRLGVDAWFTLPHRADDNYVRKFATQVHTLHKAPARVWVEFSNEVWNGAFSQHREVASCSRGSKEDNTYAASNLCYAERALEVFRIWREVFKDRPEALKRVLASQIASTWASERILKHHNAYKEADALAIAPYFGARAEPGNAARLAKLNVDQLIAETRRKHLPETLRYVHEQVALAKKYGLPLVAYEGGPSFDAAFGSENNAAINRLFDAVNRDKRMGALYTQLLKGWSDTGGADYIHFTSCAPYSKWSRFGALEYLTQPRGQAPKYDALLRFIEAQSSQQN